MFKVYSFLVLCVAYSLGKEIIFRDCPKGIPEAPPNGNQIKSECNFIGCEGDPCILEKGGTYTVETNLTFAVSISKITFKGVVVASTLPYPLTYDDSADFCEFIVLGSCQALTTGKMIGLKRTFQISKAVPPFNGFARIVYKDEKGTVQYCGEFNVAVKGDMDPNALKEKIPNSALNKYIPKPF